MSGLTAVEPEALEEYVRTERHRAERQRRAMVQVQRAFDDLGVGRHEVAPIVGGITTDLRRALGRAEDLAAHVAATATAFRSADELLHRLGGGSSTTTTDPGPVESGTILPAPDVSIEWHWPSGWTITRQWGDRRETVEIELAAGLRSTTGAGIDVTREAIRVGAFEEVRLGAWAVAGLGSAIGPFAANAQGEVFAGARARAEALLTVDRRGARARLGGEAFAGAQAEGSAGAAFGPVRVGVEGAVKYGIGATAEADVDLSLRRVGGRVRFGVAYGLGWDVGLEYYVEPGWIAEGVMDLGDDLVDVGSAGASKVGDALSAGASAVRRWL